MVRGSAAACRHCRCASSRCPETLAGTYTGPGYTNLTFHGKAITLKALAGPAGTTIDCQGLTQAFVFGATDGRAVTVQGESGATTTRAACRRNSSDPLHPSADPLADLPARPLPCNPTTCRLPSHQRRRHKRRLRLDRRRLPHHLRLPLPRLPGRLAHGARRRAVRLWPLRPPPAPQHLLPQQLCGTVWRRGVRVPGIHRHPGLHL